MCVLWVVPWAGAGAGARGDNGVVWCLRDWIEAAWSLKQFPLELASSQGIDMAFGLLEDVICDLETQGLRDVGVAGCWQLGLRAVPSLLVVNDGIKLREPFYRLPEGIKCRAREYRQSSAHGVC